MIINKYVVNNGGSPTPVEVEPKNVNFIDYDGKILYSYTTSEFLQLSAMPANPTHTGLVSQGWNWSFSDAQQFVTILESYDPTLWIGQTYTTSDGATKVHITLDKDGRLDGGLQIMADGQMHVNWGDGSEADTEDPAEVGQDDFLIFSHVYSTPGNYIISIYPEDFSDTTYTIIGIESIQDEDSGTEYFIGSLIFNQPMFPGSLLLSQASAYTSRVTEINIGNNCKIGIQDNEYGISNVLGDLRNLKSITIPYNEYTLYIGVSTFVGCPNLKTIIIPGETNIFGNVGHTPTMIDAAAFAECGVETIALPCSTEFSDRSNEFISSHIKNISLGYTTFISSGMFEACYLLEKILIPPFVQYIGQGAFQECYNLTSIKTTKATAALGGYQLTEINNDAFSYSNGVATLYLEGSGENSNTLPDLANYAFRNSNFRQQSRPKGDAVIILPHIDTQYAYPTPQDPTDDNIYPWDVLIAYQSTEGENLEQNYTFCNSGAEVTFYASIDGYRRNDSSDQITTGNGNIIYAHEYQTE